MAASRARDIGPVGPAGPRKLGRAALNADTSAEPEGLTRRVMLNIMEAFFRRPLVHLLPLIVMVLLGAFTAFRTPEEFRAVGTISAASSTPIGEVTEQNEGTGFETAATVTARDIGEKLRTDVFLNRVAESAGLAGSPDMAAVRTAIAQAVSASADGDSLVRIAAMTDQPQLSADLASSTLTAYRETSLENSLRLNQQSEQFLQTQVDAARGVLDSAEDALFDYLADNPGPEVDRPAPQQVEVDRRRAEVTRATSRYNTALDALAAAQLRTAQAEIQVDQRLQIVDQPQVPAGPQPRLKNAVLTLILFAVLGLGLTLASVVISATLDRTIRLPNDIAGRFGLEVLAVVPDVRRR